MALLPGCFVSGFNSSSGLSGISAPQLFLGVELALFKWIVDGGITLKSFSTGSIGAGVIQGKIICPPPAIPAILSTTRVCGLNGPAAQDVVIPIAMGTQIGFNTAQYAGTSSKVSSGADAAVIDKLDRQGLYDAIYDNLVSTFGGDRSKAQALPVFCTAIMEVISAVVAPCTGVGAVIPTGIVGPSASLGDGEKLTIF